MKTILFLAPANSIHSWRWISSFKEKGFRVVWISLHKYDQTMSKEYCGIKPKCFYRSSSFFINIFFALKYIYLRKSKEKIDLIHSHSVASYGILGAFSRIKPFVATAWGSDVLVTGKSFPSRVFIKYVLKKADLLTCDAQHMSDAICDFGVKRSKVKVIDFGVDTLKFNKLKKPSEKYSKEFSNDRIDFNVISLRNHYKVYDIQTLIKSIPIVIEQIDNVQFIIAGTGPETKALEGLVKELNIHNRVLFFGGYNGEELPEIFSAVDIYISTSLSDAGLSSSTAEAMSCCTPVVISDVADNDVWIKNKYNGMLFNAGDYKKLAKIIIELYKNPSERIKMGEKGRSIIVRNKDSITEMHKMNELYNSCLLDNN